MKAWLTKYFWPLYLIALGLFVFVAIELIRAADANIAERLR